MNGAKLSNNELIQIIFEAAKENGLEPKTINEFNITIIISQYLTLCNEFQNYVIGELDTFKRAACLMVAINRKKVTSDRKLNASIAIDAAYKMCEKPYWNVGENFDIPEKLEEINIQSIFKNDSYVYVHSKNMLIESLIYENGSPINYHLNLELIYQVALKIKNNRKIESNNFIKTKIKYD